MKRSWLWIAVGILALEFLYLPALGISGGQILVFFLVLLCPPMHLLGMHRHGDHGKGSPAGDAASTPGERQSGVSEREMGRLPT